MQPSRDKHKIELKNFKWLDDLSLNAHEMPTSYQLLTDEIINKINQLNNCRKILWTTDAA